MYFCFFLDGKEYGLKQQNPAQQLDIPEKTKKESNVISNPGAEITKFHKSQNIRSSVWSSKGKRQGTKFTISFEADIGELLVCLYNYVEEANIEVNRYEDDDRHPVQTRKYDKVIKELFEIRNLPYATDNQNNCTEHCKKLTPSDEILWCQNAIRKLIAENDGLKGKTAADTVFNMYTNQQKEIDELDFVADNMEFKITFGLDLGSNQVIQVFNVKNIYELVLAEIYNFQLGSKQKIKICPECHRAFLQKHCNGIYCSKHCLEQYNAKRLANDSYHRKYRSLLQRYNAITNADKLDYEAPDKYKRWQVWASKELKKVQELNKDDRTEIESPDDFAIRLKEHWDEIHKTAR